MNKKDEALLEKNGWTVECESPFEIRTKDGSFATGEAAGIVLHHLKHEASLEWYQSGNEVLQPLRFHVHELLQRMDDENRFCLRIGEPPAFAETTMAEARAASKKAEDFFTK